MARNQQYYLGINNPSAAIALNTSHFIVADDEDNLLRIYARNVTTQPLQTIALTALFPQHMTDGDDQEIDLEGAAQIDDTLFWIGSHSTSRKGQSRPARQRLLALSLAQDEHGYYQAHPVGSIFTTLLDALAQDDRFAPYQLQHARTIQSKSIGGLNIEGLSATPDKTLLIGFRNPLRGGYLKKDRLQKGRALLVELLNPFAVLYGQPALFADPIELDLHGLGIRDISWYKKQKYLIVAGPYHDNVATEDWPREKNRLYRWSKKSGKLKRLKKIDLHDLNIETAIFYPGQEHTVQLLSDDGQLGSTQGFRSVTVGF